MKSRALKHHDLFEWLFCLAMYFMTAITFITAAGVYLGYLTMPLLETNSNFYFICIFLYAGARQLRRRLYPETMTDRRNEFVVVGWILFTVLVAIDATFLRLDNANQQLDLLKQLVLIDGVVAGILVGGEAIKYILDLWLGSGTKKS